MSSLKILRDRIGSIQSTRKITRAMKFISASRLRQARDNVEVASNYIQEFKKLMLEVDCYCSTANNFYASSSTIEEGIPNLFIILTSYKGLCGQFNSVILKKLKEELLDINSKKLNGNKVNDVVLCIGKKGFDNIKKDKDIEVINSDLTEPVIKNYSFSYSKNIANMVSDLLLKRTFYNCYVIYNRFISIMQYSPIIERLWPISIKEDFEVSSNNFSTDKLIYSSEPSINKIKSYLESQYFAVKFHEVMLNSLCSEYSARFVAMDNAARNSGEILLKLSREYNRSRQASITSELIEIISGAQCT